MSLWEQWEAGELGDVNPSHGRTSCVVSGLLLWLSGEESTCNAGDTRYVGLIPGSGRSPGGGNGNPFQCSCLKNPMDRGAWWATVYGVTKSLMNTAPLLPAPALPTDTGIQFNPLPQPCPPRHTAGRSGNKKGHLCHKLLKKS